MEELPGPLITDQQNFSLETKQEPEYVSTTTNIFLSSEHTGGMFFSSFLCVLVFFSPCGWWNVLGSGADGWQASWAVEWHGSERVRWPCGWPGSGGCLATRRPRAGCTESQRMMDWPMWVPVGKPCCYFDLLFGQRSEHTLVMGFDWLLWLVTGVLGLEYKPFGSLFELFEFTLSPILCVKCKSSKQLWQTVKPLQVGQMNSSLTYFLRYFFHITATIV